MSLSMSRREMLALTAAGVATTGHSAYASETAPVRPQKPRMRLCLNMSTVRGQNLTPPQQVELAARAGYDAIEPWIGDLQKYVEQGGSLSDLRKRIDDLGLTVESAIGFAEWIVDDDAQRAKGMENAKRDMEIVQKIGGKRIAAPPSGATKQPNLSLVRAAERYRTLLDAGREIGVVPQLELWGFSQTLSRLSEVLFVAAESGHPDACVLPDVFHIHKGGSQFTSLQLINGRAIHVFHMNDFPAEPERSTITDADRIFPGDGVAPLPQMLRDLHEAGFIGALSLELFSRELWKQDATAVALSGIEKMRSVLQKAFA